MQIYTAVHELSTLVENEIIRLKNNFPDTVGEMIICIKFACNGFNCDLISQIASSLTRKHQFNIVYPCIIKTLSHTNNQYQDSRKVWIFSMSLTGCVVIWLYLS